MTHTLPHAHILNNRYRINSLIGQGGFGITYEAQDQLLDIKVCIKELFIAGNSTRGENLTVNSQTTKAFSFSDFVQRFIEEARQLAKFRHPNIVRVIDVFQENQTAYMVMEFVEGTTLKEIINTTGPSSLEAANQIIWQLLDSVETVHAKGMLHRDIKPDNILVSKDNKVVLIDFGSAREFAEGKTLTQTAILTPGYAPPEQYSDRAKRGPFTDIYALGATIYFMLTGQKPLAITDRVSEQLKAPHELNPKISTQASSAIMLAMQMKAEDRFQIVEEFREALEQLKRKEKKATINTPPKEETAPVKEKAPAAKTILATEPKTEAIPEVKNKKTSSSKTVLLGLIGIVLFVGIWMGWPYLMGTATTHSESTVITEGNSIKPISKDNPFQKIAGKRLYYSIYPNEGDGALPYQNFCFLGDGKMLGSANKTGIPWCPTSEIFIGKWKVNDDMVSVVYNAYTTEVGNLPNSNRKHYFNFQVNKLDNLNDFALELGKAWWGREITADEFNVSIRFDKIKNWVFDDIPLFYSDWKRAYPQASTRRLTTEELNAYSKEELRIMRNEIFAQYGYKFKSADLQQRFGEAPCIASDNVDALLSPIELENVKIIQKVEAPK